MKKISIGFKINLMVDVFALLIILAIIANYKSIGTMQELNSTVTDICIELETLQGNIRDNFQQVRLYANFTYYKRDLPVGYDTIIKRLTSSLSSLDENFKEAEKLCKQSNDENLLKISSSLSNVLNSFHDYIGTISSTAQAGQFNELPTLIDDLTSYTTQVENFMLELQDAIYNLTDNATDRSTVYIKNIYLFNRIIIGICIALWIIILILVRKTISKPAKLSGKSLRNIVDNIEGGNGDLTQRIPVKTRDEIGQMVNGINNFIEQLQNIMKKLKHQSEILRSSATLIGTQVVESNENASNISAFMEELSANMEQISATLGQIVSGSSTVLNKIQDMDKSVKESVGMVSESKILADKMYHNTINSKETASKIIEEIRSSLSEALEESRSVGKINDLTQEILDISGQTNLLSLNASIEAARAGDAGRGFAVVANEIRALADNSTQTAGNIQKISKIVTNAVNKFTKNAEDILQFIDEKILKDYDDFVGIAKQYESDTDTINQLLNEFASNTEDISSTIQSMNQGLNDISTATDESTHGVTTSAENIINLVGALMQIQNETENNKHISQDLETEVSRFKKL